MLQRPTNAAKSTDQLLRVPKTAGSPRRRRQPAGRPQPRQPHTASFSTAGGGDRGHRRHSAQVTHSGSAGPRSHASQTAHNDTETRDKGATLTETEKVTTGIELGKIGFDWIGSVVGWSARRNDSARPDAGHCAIGGCRRRGPHRGHRCRWHHPGELLHLRRVGVWWSCCV